MAPSILITAGPTIEPIDPVRFISNRSTGYMGYELAKEAKKRNYRVTLISGPTKIKPPEGLRLIRIESAAELCSKVAKELKKAQILIMASAVSDFRPAGFSRKKIKSRASSLELRLVRNPDILKSIPEKLRKNRIIVGFSLETNNLLKNSLRKLKEKNLDLVVANKAGGPSGPFGKGKKSVYLLERTGRKKKLENAAKPRIARAILDTIDRLCYTPN